MVKIAQLQRPFSYILSVLRSSGHVSTSFLWSTTMIPKQSPSFLLCSLLLLASTITTTAKDTGHGAAAGLRVAKNHSKMLLSFEINEGQADARVKFLSHGVRSTLFLTADELVMVLGKRHAEETLDMQASPRKLGHLAHPMEYSVLRMKLIGANLHAKVAAQAELPGAFQTTYGGGSADGFVSQIACP